jgi:hypothetical protein
MDFNQDFLDSSFNKVSAFLNSLAISNDTAEFADECVKILNDSAAMAYVHNIASFHGTCKINPFEGSKYVKLYEDIHMAMCVQYSVFKEDDGLSKLSPEFRSIFSGRSDRELFESSLLKNMTTQMVATFMHYEQLPEKYPNVISKI